MDACRHVARVYGVVLTMESALACQAMFTLAEQLGLEENAWDPDPFAKLDACMQDWDGRNAGKVVREQGGK